MSETDRIISRFDELLGTVAEYDDDDLQLFTDTVAEIRLLTDEIRTLLKIIDKD